MILDYQDVEVSFGEDDRAVRALGGVNLRVEEGEFLCVVGPSGCGKSTLLNLAAGLFGASRGTVRFDDRPLAGINTEVGYLTQKDSLLPWRNVINNVALPLELNATPKRERLAKATQYIELVGLQGFERHYPSQLSGGMRRRVALARTLIYEPRVLLMDEPFGALDAQLKLILQAELLQVWSRTRQTIVFVTHDLAEAVMLGDRVVVISSRPGQVRDVAPVDLARPRDVFGGRFTPEFGAIFDRLWASLEQDIRQGEEI